jgi:hypothetical protein
MSGVTAPAMVAAKTRSRIIASKQRRARGEQAALFAYNAHLAVKPTGKLVPGWVILSNASRAPEIGHVETTLPMPV